MHDCSQTPSLLARQGKQGEQQRTACKSWQTTCASSVITMIHHTMLTQQITFSAEHHATAHDCSQNLGSRACQAEQRD